MNHIIKIPKNKYFNKNFKNVLRIYLKEEKLESSKFQEINFFYLFNLPSIEIDKNNGLKIKINEDVAKFEWDSSFLRNLLTRREETIFQLRKTGYEICKTMIFSVSWRLIIGLGASHPQETSMTLHHIYGIPYIPGSAVKGVTKHWTILKFADKFKEEEKSEDFEKAIKEISTKLDLGDKLDIKVGEITFQNIIDIFGTQKQEGKVIFFDSYPIDNLKLKIDIMNPHYPQYYSKKEAPTDWQKPNPIKFLTIDTKTKFQFYLAGKDKELLNKAQNLLKEALENLGVGAKTSLGYGILENFTR